MGVEVVEKRAPKHPLFSISPAVLISGQLITPFKNKSL